MRAIGRIIVEAIRRRDDPAAQARLAAEVAAIVARFPVPGLHRGLMSFIPDRRRRSPRRSSSRSSPRRSSRSS